MIDVETAIRIAEEVLNQDFQLDDDSIVVTDVQEADDHYCFSYNSRRYNETGDLMYALVEGHPIYVSKQDGSVY